MVWAKNGDKGYFLFRVLSPLHRNKEMQKDFYLEFMFFFELTIIFQDDDAEFLQADRTTRRIKNDHVGRFETTCVG